MNNNFGILGQFEEGQAHIVGPSDQGVMPEFTQVGFQEQHRGLQRVGTNLDQAVNLGPTGSFNGLKFQDIKYTVVENWESNHVDEFDELMSDVHEKVMGLMSSGRGKLDKFKIHSDFEQEFTRIYTGWRSGDQVESEKVRGDEIHVGSLTQSESSKKKHFI